MREAKLLYLGTNKVDPMSALLAKLGEDLEGRSIKLEC